VYLPETYVLLYLTSLIPDSGSSAVRVKVTKVVFVYNSPSLISIDPVGGVSSLAPSTSNKPPLKNKVTDKSSNRIRTNNESVLLLILQPLIMKAAVTGYMCYEIIFYLARIR
jgi:hypothetical protein